MNARAAILLLMSTHSVLALDIRDALGQVESSNNDHAIGKAGEVSRFQILPSVWRTYEKKFNPTDQILAWTVAQKCLKARSKRFESNTGSKPTPNELYALWNAPGVFASRSYQFGKLPPVIRARAERFANLIEKPYAQTKPDRQNPQHPHPSSR